ncbi:MAG: alpha-glucan family phosphorylase [Acidiferrobacterales bacterium]|jgi:starch phosphorylase|nr:alpha-glucan family phosphorylase [Acidiferrobacterales bacterium]
MSATRFTFEVQPRIPKRLARLQELANDLLYSWDRQVRGLFFRLDRELWDACGHNPKLFLRRVSQEILDEAAKDRIFMEDYNRALTVYDVYLSQTMRSEVSGHLDPEKDLIAYFCAEFGLHESVPLYSGGLGILAGDHCKAASDLSLPFIGVGLLYRRGYFNQTIDGQGNQIAHFTPTDFNDLPITPALDDNGNEVHVSVDMAGRDVRLKVWIAKAGHISLVLLDSYLEENTEDDRRVTYQLYGGDRSTRIQQEIVLGIGGIRALRALGYQPTVWHINEGHAAFQILERIREKIEQGMDFAGALELVASGTVFTTHTPVPAGHDIFSPELFTAHFKQYSGQLKISLEELMSLGESPSNHGGFNMTALALRGSRFHNGVSRIHGHEASRMEGYIWPQIPYDENPIRYVTNGVHVPTFLAREWVNLFDMRFDRTWRSELLSEEYWERIDTIPSQNYWSIRQTLKSELLEDVRQRSHRQHLRNGCSDVQIDRLIQHLASGETDILTLGFARRFATYKRALLLFSDPERLARIVNNPERPVLIMFAGKAHPSDVPGQELIRTISEYSRQPEFEGKIILLEGYDISLARKLVTGVDVWVNTPEYPMEASGTSGQKAGINGVINLSVLDGWWGEGYNGENGWAITPHGPKYDPAFRDQEEGHTLLDILEHEVVPLYYARDGHGYSEGWVKKSKASMKSTMPLFNAQRMVMDYVQDFYGPAARQRVTLGKDNAAPAKALAEWKSKVAAVWGGVSIHRIDNAPTEINAGDSLPIRVAVNLNGLTPDDVRVECLVGTESEMDEMIVDSTYAFEPTGKNEQGEDIFELDLLPRLAGLQYFQIRMHPMNENLSHPLETGRLIWI